MVLVIVALLALLAASAGLAGVGLARRRSKLLRRRFSSEYLRLLMEHGDRRAVEHELARRLRRHRSLRIRALSDEERRQFAAEWARIQEGFVDGPAEAVEEAERLLVRIASRCGYPDLGPQRRLDDLSVDYPDQVVHYRGALELRSGAAEHKDQDRSAATEDLRQALMRYREFLSTVLAGAAGPGHQSPGAAQTPGIVKGEP